MSTSPASTARATRAGASGATGTTGDRGPHRDVQHQRALVTVGREVRDLADTKAARPDAVERAQARRVQTARRRIIARPPRAAAGRERGSPPPRPARAQVAAVEPDPIAQAGKPLGVAARCGRRSPRAAARRGRSAEHVRGLRRAARRRPRARPRSPGMRSGRSRRAARGATPPRSSFTSRPRSAVGAPRAPRGERVRAGGERRPSPSRRSTPSRARIPAERVPPGRLDRRERTAGAGGVAASTRRGTAPAWTTMALRPFATSAWSSVAMRTRSSSTALRARLARSARSAFSRSSPAAAPAPQRAAREHREAEEQEKPEEVIGREALVRGQHLDEQSRPEHPESGPDLSIRAVAAGRVQHQQDRHERAGDVVEQEAVAMIPWRPTPTANATPQRGPGRSGEPRSARQHTPSTIETVRSSPRLYARAPRRRWRSEQRRRRRIHSQRVHRVHART